MINLNKGDAPVTLTKSDTIGARISWPAQTDYDLGVEILYADGSSESLAAFGAAGVPAKMVSRDGSVVHNGDAGRGGGMAEETITIHTDKIKDILMIAPWAYSAQSNGTGSFRKYAVSMEVSNGADTVRIDASNASDSMTVYTCVPGIIHFKDGSVQVEYAEMYSARGSESRPQFRSGLFGPRVGLRMDGPRNNYK